MHLIIEYFVLRSYFESNWIKTSMI